MLNRLPSRSSANWQPATSCCLHDSSDCSASARHDSMALLVFKPHLLSAIISQISILRIHPLPQSYYGARGSYGQLKARSDAYGASRISHRSKLADWVRITTRHSGGGLEYTISQLLHLRGTAAALAAPIGFHDSKWGAISKAQDYLDLASESRPDTIAK